LSEVKLSLVEEGGSLLIHLFKRRVENIWRHLVMPEIRIIKTNWR
jgi:hypothetical protein